MSKENASAGQGEKLRVVENYPGVEDCWVWTLPGPEKFASDGHLSIRNAELVLGRLLTVCIIKFDPFREGLVGLVMLKE